MNVFFSVLDLRKALSKILVGSLILQPFSVNRLAYANGTESADQVKLSPEEALDKYSLALYETLVALERNTPKPNELDIIKTFRSEVQSRMRAASFDPYALRADFEAHREDLGSLGAQACLEIEYGLAQLVGDSTKYMSEERQFETLEQIVEETKTIRAQASCLGENYQHGKPLNLTADFTYLSALLQQGVELGSDISLSKDLRAVLNVHLAIAMQGATDAQFFNMERMKRQFAEAGMPFSSIEDVKSEAYKRELLSKAKVGGLFLGGFTGFMMAFLGAGRIVEEGIAASSALVKYWNRVGAPLIATWSRGRFLGQLESLEKASYVLSSSIIGGLGGASVHGLEIAAETFKDATVQSFAKESTLGAELIPAIAHSMNADKIGEGMSQGGKVGAGAGAALTFGSFEYLVKVPWAEMPKKFNPRHATLVILASAVVFSTAMSGYNILKFIGEGREALVESESALSKLKPEMSRVEKQEIFREAKKAKVKAYNAFGEAALNGIDVAILSILVNELFIKGELFHIWHAEESEVIPTVATASDETPQAANGVMQTVQGASGKENVAAKTGNLIGNLSDETGKVAGSMGNGQGAVKGVAMKSIVAKSGSLTGATSTAPVVVTPPGMEQISPVMDHSAVITSLPPIDKIIHGKKKKEKVAEKKKPKSQR